MNIKWSPETEAHYNKKRAEMNSPNNSNNFLIRLLIGLFFIFSGIAFLLGGVFVFCKQIYIFLQSGVWSGISTIKIINYFIDASWLLHPEKWIGVHKVLSFIPASLCLVVIGFFFLVAGNDILNESNKKNIR